MQIWDNYVSIYASHELNAINNVTRSTIIHTLHIIGICPWINRHVTLYIYVPLHCYCILHKNPTLLHISVIEQQIATLIYPSIAIYVLATNMPLKRYVYTNNFAYFIARGLPIYVPHMNLLASTMWPAALYTDEDVDEKDNAVRLHELSWPVAKSARKVCLVPCMTWPWI